MIKSFSFIITYYNAYPIQVEPYSYNNYNRHPYHGQSVAYPALLRDIESSRRDIRYYERMTYGHLSVRNPHICMTRIHLHAHPILTCGPHACYA